MNRPIQVTRSSMPPMDEYTDEIKDLWDTHWLTNMGVKHHKLEQMLKNYLKTPYITLFTNGHLALECIFSALKLTGEVITTPFTFASTTHAIVRTGLKPVFCDIREEDCTIDPDRIESLITKNTCAIVPIHVYGNLCDTERIEEIARKYNLKVVYDAAHAFGVSRYGKSSACFGDASMFSFHATKVFNTIEGGAV
ncbi:MAG TPA: aminotransferase class I/II-fold pyridoxal phosphate-dependent enzyme, partial [Petrotogaceae bacterium]|nr:aminotransferase class I/II-fold pyridoxal phosphate-dependent enzyme [Petrotogaceae bacterium]